MTRKNSMGSEVVDGFKCKPRELDENKPIMFSAVHLFLCEGERCSCEEPAKLAERLRDLVKTLGFDRGKNRIKITRTRCNGACRFGRFAYAYKNIDAECFDPKNAFTAWKHVHQWRDEQWRKLLLSLISNEDVPELDPYRVEQKIF